MGYFRTIFTEPLEIHQMLYGEEGYFRTIYTEGSHWALGNIYGGFNLIGGDTYGRLYF